MNWAIYGRDLGRQDIAFTMNCLTNVYLEQCNYREARKMREKCLDMSRKMYGQSSNYIDIASALMGLGRLNHEEGNYYGAAEKYRDSLEIRRVIHKH